MNTTQKGIGAARDRAGERTRILRTLQLCDWVAILSLFRNQQDSQVRIFQSKIVVEKIQQIEKNP